MLKIRFQRTGRKNDPAFRIVVTEHTASPRAGTNAAVVGSYHPKTKATAIDADAVKSWLAKGAKASGTVHNLLVSKGVIEGKKVNVLKKKTPIVKEAPAEKSRAKDATVPEPEGEATPEVLAGEEEKEKPAA